jgi:SAM-dependent methyltransferase
MNNLLMRLWRGTKILKKAFLPGFNDRVLNVPHLAAKFYPYQPGKKSYIVPRTACGSHKGESGPPLPPKDLRYHGGTNEEYLSNGKKLVENMKGVLEASGSALRLGNRILDFGCADGFLVRWLLEFAESGEVWGVDINGTHIIWCQQNLTPLRFVTTTSFPHLPFEDGYFDLVYEGSVFTHIVDIADAWLLELKRVIRPGGKLYLTVHDNHAIDLLLTKHKDDPGLPKLLQSFDKQSRFTASGFAMFTINRAPGEGSYGQAQVFYDIDYLRQHWGNYLKIISITPEAYGYQTAVLLEK